MAGAARGVGDVLGALGGQNHASVFPLIRSKRSDLSENLLNRVRNARLCGSAVPSGYCGLLPVAGDRRRA